MIMIGGGRNEIWTNLLSTQETERRGNYEGGIVFVPIGSVVNFLM